ELEGAPEGEIRFVLVEDVKKDGVPARGVKHLEAFAYVGLVSEKVGDYDECRVPPVDFERPGNGVGKRRPSGGRSRAKHVEYWGYRWVARAGRDDVHALAGEYPRTYRVAPP